MSDPQYEYFYRSIDQEPNRELVRRISEQVVEALRPDEAIFTEHIFDELMEFAAQGKVVQVDDETLPLSFGGAELLLLVVVPVVTSALTAAFVGAKVAGVRGVVQPPDIRRYLTRSMLEQAVHDSGIQFKRGEVDRLFTALLESTTSTLPLAAGAGPESRKNCCGYPYMQLRIFLASAFSVDELRTLCFDMNESHEDVLIEAQAKSANVVNAIEYFGRRGRLCRFLELARERRTDLDWVNLTPPTA